MSGDILNFNLLNSFEKKEVVDFIDFLYNKKRKCTATGLNNYKKKIQSVSVWGEEDLKIFDENKKHFDQWKPETW